MIELRFAGEELRQNDRSVWTGRMRRLALLVAVTLLCGAAYIAGVWYGMQGGITCTVSSPTVIVCGSDADATPPARPTSPARDSGSA